MKLSKLLSIVVIGLLGNGLGLPTKSALAQAPNQIADVRSTELAEAEKLVEQADLLERQGKYNEAVLLAEQSLSIRKRILGERHGDVATSLFVLAGIYTMQGHYEQAESFYIQSLELRRSLLGERHQAVAASLNNLAYLYEAQGRYEKAKPLLIQSLALSRSLFGERHISVATSLNNLAYLYSEQGLYKEAESLYIQSLELRRSLLGKRHRDVADSLNNLAGLYQLQGRYAEAEPLYTQSLKLNISLLGERHPSVAFSLNNLAALYRVQGRYAEAEALYIQSLNLRKLLLGNRHPAVANALNNLAELHENQGQYEQAKLLYIQSLELFQSQFGENHLQVAKTLNNLALLYQRKRQYKESELLYMKALKIQKLLLDNRHPDIALSLHNLAGLYKWQGRYKEAELLYLQAIELHSLMGNRHPYVAMSLNNLAVLYEMQGQYEKAISYLEKGMTIQETNLVINLAIGNEDQKLAYFETVNLTGTTDASISLHLQHARTNSKAASLAFNTILKRKGRILDNIASLLEKIRRTPKPSERDQLNQLSNTYAQLSTLYHKGLGKLTLDQYRIQVTELEQKATQSSNDLSRSNAEFGSTSQPITLESTQQHIPSDKALIELVRYQPFNSDVKLRDKQSSHYAAYVLIRSGTLKALDLGPAKAIDEALLNLRQNLQDQGTPITQVKASARKLDALLMQPIRSHIGPIRNLLLSPDSSLNLLPFETLVDEQGRYLLETHNITYLTSGSDLRRLQNSKPNNNPAVILADPYFGKPGTIANQTTRTLDLTKQSFPPLSGTRTETTTIATLLGTQAILGSDATETAIKQAKSPKILHIATHGFFQPTPKNDKTNPLLNSGLVFAGFQVGKSGTDDGILTALEVSNLNLSDTKLVTLSACDTGLGTISNGEGIYGLRRALTIAGAESQTISLWKVSDDATKDLMVNYYARLNKGEGRSNALHNAQRDMLKSEKYSHPYYWAAFIPSGDWRPIKSK
jgi:CHAT domain-containing protein